MPALRERMGGPGMRRAHKPWDGGEVEMEGKGAHKATGSGEKGGSYREPLKYRELGGWHIGSLSAGIEGSQEPLACAMSSADRSYKACNAPLVLKNVHGP